MCGTPLEKTMQKAFVSGVGGVKLADSFIEDRGTHVA
jgi:hypothetical protein